MKVAVTLHRSIQTSPDSGMYKAVETRVFGGSACLDAIMRWARKDGRYVEWHNLVFTPIDENPTPSEVSGDE